MLGNDSVRLPWIGDHACCIPLRMASQTTGIPSTWAAPGRGWRRPGRLANVTPRTVSCRGPVDRIHGASRRCRRRKHRDSCASEGETQRSLVRVKLLSELVNVEISILTAECQWNTEKSGKAFRGQNRFLGAIGHYAACLHQHHPFDLRNDIGQVMGH